MHCPDEELWDQLLALETLSAEVELEHDKILAKLHQRGWSWSEISARWGRCSPSQISRRARAADLGRPVP